MRVSTADVVRHFLRLEASRKKYASKAKELFAICELPDSEVIARALVFAGERDDVNPALLYLGGQRANQVAYWALEEVSCDTIYSCGISRAVNGDLASVSGNLPEFYRQFGDKYPEFSKPWKASTEDTAILILVAQQTPGKTGTHELVDGAHRLGALCRSGSTSVMAFVGHKKGA